MSILSSGYFLLLIDFLRSEATFKHELEWHRIVSPGHKLWFINCSSAKSPNSQARIRAWSRWKSSQTPHSFVFRWLSFYCGVPLMKFFPIEYWVSLCNFFSYSYSNQKCFHFQKLFSLHSVVYFISFCSWAKFIRSIPSRAFPKYLFMFILNW